MTVPSYMTEAEKVRARSVEETESSQPEPRLQMKRFSELYLNREPLAWRIKGLLPEVGIAYMFGESGGMKTFLQVNVGMHIAMGRPFRERVTKPGTVSILAGEGNIGLVHRVSAWIQAHDGTYDPDLHISNTGGNIDTSEGISEVFAALDAQPTAPRVVIVDTQSRFQIGDESSTRDGAAFVRALDSIRDRYECLVIVVHHTPVSDPTRIRGSGTFRGATDAMFLVRKNVTKGGIIVTMECQKMKEAQEPPPMAWEAKEIELDGFETEDGEPVTSCWLNPIEYEVDKNAGRPATDIPHEIAVAIVKEYPGASQNELTEFLAERASEVMDRKVGKTKARGLLQKLASLEPPRLIRMEDGKRITYRVSDLDFSQKPQEVES